MSAAEKLGTLDMKFENDVDVLADALPQLVTVVEAAERTDDGPNLGPGSYRICRVCGYDLNFAGSSTNRADGHGDDCALAALDEALT